MCEYIDISYEEIGMVQQLWDKNRQYHEETSRHFGHLYSNLDFHDRMKDFSQLGQDFMKITVAKDHGVCVGYCISIVQDGRGELASIHVSAVERGKGIGRTLAKMHLDWMKEKKCGTIGVTVSYENERTISFYESLGFYSNTINMQLL